jgi:putative PIN family toxin of toxin-antitoxin system
LEQKGQAEGHPYREGPGAVVESVKAVFDSNIFVSAIAIPGGRADTAIMSVVNGSVGLVISKEIIQEVLAVLARKFSKDAEELSRVAVFLSNLGEIVRPKTKLKVLEDDPDNRILECAIAGKADVIVTGDKAILALLEYHGMRIISLRRFIEYLAEER